MQSSVTVPSWCHAGTRAVTKAVCPLASCSSSCAIAGFPFPVWVSVVRARRGPSQLMVPTYRKRSSPRRGYLQGFCGQFDGPGALPLSGGGYRVDPAVSAVLVGVGGAERGRQVGGELGPRQGNGSVGAGDAEDPV